MSKSLGFNKGDYKVLESDIDEKDIDHILIAPHNDRYNYLWDVGIELQHKLQKAAEKLDVHLFDMTYFTGVDVCEFLSYYNPDFEKVFKEEKDIPKKDKQAEPQP